MFFLEHWKLIMHDWVKKFTAFIFSLSPATFLWSPQFHRHCKIHLHQFAVFSSGEKHIQAEYYRTELHAIQWTWKKYSIFHFIFLIAIIHHDFVRHSADSNVNILLYGKVNTQLYILPYV